MNNRDMVFIALVAVLLVIVAVNWRRSSNQPGDLIREAADETSDAINEGVDKIRDATN